MNGRKAFLFLLIIGLAVLMISSPVSAEIFSKTYEDSSYSYWQSNYQRTGGVVDDGLSSSYVLYFLDGWSNYDGLRYIGGETSSYVRWSGGDTNTVGVQLKQGSTTYATGSLTVVKKYNPNTGAYIGLKYWMFLDNFDMESLQSNNPNIRYLQIVPDGYFFSLYQGSYVDNLFSTYAPLINSYTNEYGEGARIVTCLKATSNGRHGIIPGEQFTVCALYPQYKLTLYSDWDENIVNSITINSYDDMIRVTGYSDSVIMFDGYESGERDYPYHLLPLNVTSYLPDGTIVSDIIGEGVTPSTNKASIITRVYSLADNSLIAGSKVYYRALDGSDLVNETLPSGTGEFLLQKGLRYEFWAEASGYENQTSIPDQAAFYADSGNEIRLTPTYGDEPEEGMGVYNLYISEQTNAAGDTTTLTSPATVTLNWQTKLTTSSGHVSFQVNKSAQVSYTIRKDGYVTVSRIYTPSWTGDTINEYISIRKEGQVLPGEPTPISTPDHRSSEAKAESALNIIFDNIEAIATLSVVVVILAMCDWMTPKRRK